MSRPTVLITGATGFLGGALARRLQAEGWQVLATGRNAEAGAALEQAGMAFTQCDLAQDFTSVTHLVEQCSHVVHCAALSSPWGRRRAFQQANVVATENVLRACRAAQVTRLVAISSPSVTFAYEAQRALQENAPWPEPAANGYIATKRLAELAVLAAAAAGLPAVVLRPKAMIGPGDTTLIPRVLKVATRGRFPLFGQEDVPLDLTWIGDAVEAVKLSLHAGPVVHGRVYHITSGQPLSRRLVLETLFQACGLKVDLRPLPIKFALGLGSALEAISRLATLGNWEPPLTKYSVGALGFGQTLDISAAQKDLGYAPRTDLLAKLRACGEAWRAAQQSS
jgi:nucleoside-diphosphate-sugar epimerase